MLRSLILAAADNRAVNRLVAEAPVSRSVVRRYVAGDDVPDAARVTRQLAESGLLVSLDHLGEHTTDVGKAKAAVDAYLTLLERLSADELTPTAEVSVKLSAIGQALDPQLTLAHAQHICAAAEQGGTTVTLDMEDHTTTDATLEALRELRTDFPSTGAVVQAYLRRTEGDCADLAYPGSRVRLCKGAYAEPESVAYTDPHDVDLSYVRCANLLASGGGYPMFATHDPRLIDIVQERAAWHGRTKDSWEFQMLYGVRPQEQARLAAAGHRVRVYVPYGAEWYAYLMRRLAERPANLGFFLRSLVSKG